MPVFLIKTAKIGFPHTKKQTLALVQQIVDSRGISTTLSNGWWERFCQRHHKVTLRSAVPFSLARAMASDPDVMDRYFDMLEECLRANDILDKAGCTFNCDETGMSLLIRRVLKTPVLLLVGTSHS